MKTDINKTKEKRNTSGCNITLSFSEHNKQDKEEYVIGSLMNSFEKRNNICGDFPNRIA